MADPDNPVDDGFVLHAALHRVQDLLGLDGKSPETIEAADAGELASQLGISIKTLHFYRKRGLFNLQTGNAKVAYTPRDLGRLRIALAARKLGFTAEEAVTIARSYD